jgi:hypothetical protein
MRAPSTARGALGLALALAALVSPGGAAQAGDPPRSPGAPPAAPAGSASKGAQALAEARFLEHCLGRHEDAESAYRSAIRAGLTRAEQAEAEFGIARARFLSGRKEAGLAGLEELAGRIGDGGLAPWPQRARAALDRSSLGDDPFDLARAQGVYSLEVSAKPLEQVLRGLIPAARIGFAFDESFPASFLVSCSAEDATFEELMNKLVGTGRWRRVGDGVALGEIAANGVAFERKFTFESLRRPEDRAAASILCTRRVSITLPATPLAQALDVLNEVSGVRVEAAPAALAKPHAVRLFLKDARMDSVLDLLAVPIGLEWEIDGGKVVLKPRRVGRE